MKPEVEGAGNRIILNFEGEAEGVRPDAVLDDVLDAIEPEMED